MMLPKNVLHDASRYIEEKFGMNIPPESWRNLEQQICLAAEECGMAGHKDEYIAKLLDGRLSTKETETLVEQLTVGETYFFREMQSLSAMAQLIASRPATQQSRIVRSLRIWSAGCSTGEEPYSIAMMIDGLARKVPERVEILATDLNTLALVKARAASYGKWSFRGTPEWVRSSYFHPTGKDSWTLDGRVKGCVTFQQENLMDADRFLPGRNGAFDFIVCRNVLMYLTTNAIERIVKNFQRALAGGSWLIVGLSEAIPLLAAEFEMVHLGGATIYRKRPARAEIAAENYFEREQKIALVPNEHAQVVAEAASLRKVQTAAPVNERYETERTDALLAGAKQLAGQGNLPAALARCEEVILRDSTISTAHFLRAKILEEQGRDEKAMESLRRAIYLKPDFVLAHFSLASLADKNGSAEEAAKHFRNVLHLLEKCSPEEIVPHSEGLSVAGLRSLVVSLRLDIVRQLQSEPSPKENAGAPALP